MLLGKPFLDTLAGHKTERVPFWLMRQAGRYLPEYRELRAKKNGFLDMVYDPAAAAEITMQPIRRFGMDAAVIFSDILVVPHALGQVLIFAEGEGPKLDPLRATSDFSKLNFRNFQSTLTPVYEAITRVKNDLAASGFNSTAVLGFCGAPWTLAAYMIEGGGSKDFIHAKALAYKDPYGFSSLIETLVESLSTHLVRQIDAGAEAVQIFDSWAGVLDDQEFTKWVIKPTRELVKLVKSQRPRVPIIGFPRGAGQNYIHYAQETGITCIGLDSQMPTKIAARTLQTTMPVQGNLDPACLLAGGDALVMGVERVLGDLSHGNLIFNLGHGVHKDTPPEHVEQLTQLLRDHRV